MRTPPDLSGLRRQIYDRLVGGGVLDTFTGALRDYFELLKGPLPPSRDPRQQPVLFPPYPGLEARPWREREQVPSALKLEQAAARISAELSALEAGNFLHYEADIVDAKGLWSVLPLYFLGERVDTLVGAALDETVKAIEGLDDNCVRFPLADALFSAHDAGTHLVPHCSWDGFRMRLHLGLRVPSGCRIRVADETREWAEGRALVFHDSFEHETWNDGTGRRVILIVDCWDPGLTAAEREGLNRALRYKPVRELLLQLRNPGDALSEVLRAQF